MVCAWLPHIGTAAEALTVQASAHTNAARVLSCTSHCRGVWIGEWIGEWIAKCIAVIGGSLVARP
jgi:hypothetical protein